MSLQLYQRGISTVRYCRRVAAAIRSIAAITGAIEEYEIGKDDAELLVSAMTDLWTILETNGYTIDIDTNRLRRMTNER